MTAPAALRSPSPDCAWPSWASWPACLAAMRSRWCASTAARRSTSSIGADLIVVGEEQSPLVDLVDLLDDEARRAVEAGKATLITETELWQRLGLIDAQQNVHRLYTPAMLADLLGVPLAIVRRWHRRGSDRAGARSARAALLRLSGSGHRTAIGRAFGGGRLAASDRKEAGRRRPLAARHRAILGATLDHRRGEAGPVARKGTACWSRADNCDSISAAPQQHDRARRDRRGHERGSECHVRRARRG